MQIKCPKCFSKLKVKFDCISCKAREIEFDLADLEETGTIPQYIVRLPPYDYDYCHVADVYVYCASCDYTETIYVGESYKDEDECVKEVINILREKFLNQIR